MPPPFATGWSERVQPDEDARFARLAGELAAIRERFDARHAEKGRALHRQARAALSGTTTVRADLAEHLHPDLHVGPFRSGAQWRTHARLSNGSFARARAETPDVRGVALKLVGVPGGRLLDDGATTQDFLFNHTPRAFVRSPEEFVALAVAAAPGGTLGTLYRLSRRLGLGRALMLARDTVKGMQTPFERFESASFWSMVPFVLGPAAARFSLAPLPAVAPAVAWSFRVQLWTDERVTPIEDPTVDWSAPWLDVARVDLTPADDDAAEQIERMAFDPWHGVSELRPLGAVNRARRAAYFHASAGPRGALPERSHR